MAVESPMYNINLNVQETIQLLVQPSFTDQDIQNSFRVIRNLYGGKMNLAIAKQMEKFVRKAQHCNPQYAGQFKMSERSIEVKYAEGNLKWCYEELVNTYYDQLAPLYTTAQGTPSLAELLNIILGQMQIGIKRDVERVAWFGDSASVDANYDWADGIWTRIPGLVGTGEIGAYTNTGSGGAITNAQAYEFLRDVVREARPELRNMPAQDKRIYISGNMWLQVLDYLEDSAVTNGFIQVFNEAQAGIAATYRGIPIVVQDRWDEVLSNDFGLNEEHRIIYTVRDNLVVATDLRANANGGQSFFKLYQDPKDDALYIRSKFVFDTNIVFPFLMSVGY